MLQRAQIQDVRMFPGLFRNRMKLNEDYLMELDSVCLLQNFYLEAGIQLPGQQSVPDPSSARLHWGWEAPSCQLRGHFLGHWLSAAAMLCANEERPQLKAKLEWIVDELARCQALNGGEWVGSIPEKYFDMMKPGRYIWSPQYTMHKTILGLKDVYDLLGYKTAIDILDRLADWYLRWIGSIQDSYPDAVFNGEQAGMLEVWCDLFSLTGSEKYRKLIDTYENNPLFRQLDLNNDALSDEHANASIPLSHGAGRMFEITGNDQWKRRMEAFWQTAVTERGMFSTTGSNAGEFWIPLKSHSRFLCSTDQEFCTVYNMVRTAEYLYRWTGETKYADYIERALYNGFLAQQNPQTGMPTYFLPMVPGSRKTWGSRTHDFWCCFGTMVQAQALYPNLIWYTDGESVTVSQYIPSSVSMKISAGTVNVSQAVHMKNYDHQVLFDERGGGRVSRWSQQIKVVADADKEWKLKLRVPSWCAGAPVVVLNGIPLEKAVIRDSYIEISRIWKKDVLDLFFPSEVRCEPLPDDPSIFSLTDGPIVLAGQTDGNRPVAGDLSNPSSFLIPETQHTYGTFTWQQNTYRTRNQPVNFRLIPLYDIQDEPYTVYFTALTPLFSK